MNMVKMFDMKVSVSLEKYDKDHKKCNYTLEAFGRSERRPKDNNQPYNNSTSGNKNGGQRFIRKQPSGPGLNGPSFVQDGTSFADLLRGKKEVCGQGAKIVTVEGKGSLYPLHCCGRSILGHGKNIWTLSNIRRNWKKQDCLILACLIIGGLFGDLIQPSSFSWQEEDNLSSTVKMLTTQKPRFNETVVIKWNDKSIVIWVSETSERWEPNFDNETTYDTKDSESDTESDSDKEPVEMEEVEEGEIR
ncbi:hypothetical protein Hanom_Chr01g00046141 [Helianthus anomalus]